VAIDAELQVAPANLPEVEAGQVARLSFADPPDLVGEAVDLVCRSDEDQ
jgi:hypothetical protein